MKLVTFYVKALKPAVDRVGALDKNGNIVDLAVAYRAMRNAGDAMDQKYLDRLTTLLIPSDMVEFIQGGDDSLNAARAALKFAEENAPEGAVYTPDEVQLRAPIPRPSNMRDLLCFLNHFYRGEKNRKQIDVFMEQPIYYKAGATCIVGPDEVVKWPRYLEDSFDTMDFETEFACVISKPCRNVTPEEAGDYIFGFMNYNDFSARSQQFKDMDGGLALCKGKDFATGQGPYLVTKDEIEDVYNMPMRMYINGEMVVDGSTSTMNRTWEDNISYISQTETLLPGEVLGSGTVGFGCRAETAGPYLKDGDVIEEEVGCLGRLRNVISAPAGTPVMPSYALDWEATMAKLTEEKLAMHGTLED